MNAKAARLARHNPEHFEQWFLFHTLEECFAMYNSGSDADLSLVVHSESLTPYTIKRYIAQRIIARAENEKN